MWPIDDLVEAASREGMTPSVEAASGRVDHQTYGIPPNGGYPSADVRASACQPDRGSARAIAGYRPPGPAPRTGAPPREGRAEQNLSGTTPVLPE